MGLIVVLVLAVLAGPVILLVRHVQREIWDNTAKTMELAERAVPPIAAGLGAYGFASLLVRFMESVVVGRTANVGWPLWDVLLGVVGLGILVGVHQFSEKQRKEA
jgi:serine/threonine-protein kinase